MIEFTDLELFKDFIIVEYDDKIYDLHSDYECNTIAFDSGENKLTLKFNRTDNDQSFGGDVAIEFNEPRIANFSLFFSRARDSSTLNIIYRGRFEENGKLNEYSDLGERYFYFEFEAGDKFEIYSKRVFFITGI